MESGIVKLIGFLFMGVGVILTGDAFNFTGNVISPKLGTTSVSIFGIIAIFVGVLLMTIGYGKLRIKKFKK